MSSWNGPGNPSKLCLLSKVSSFSQSMGSNNRATLGTVGAVGTFFSSESEGRTRGWGCGVKACTQDSCIQSQCFSPLNHLPGPSRSNLFSSGGSGTHPLCSGAQFRGRLHARLHPSLLYGFSGPCLAFSFAKASAILRGPTAQRSGQTSTPQGACLPLSSLALSSSIPSSYSGLKTTSELKTCSAG